MTALAAISTTCALPRSKTHRSPVLNRISTAAKWKSTPLASVGYAPVVTHRDSERLNVAIKYMNSHLTGALTLTDVAHAVGLSPQAFSRFFHKFMGMPFVEYVASLRISLACRYLLETDRTIASICYLCGFNNLSNFNRIFKKRKGVTPKEFRESYTKMRILI